WPSGLASLPYQTLVTPLILEGIASLALKNACQSASVASLMEVQAKQCINLASAACAAPALIHNAAAQSAVRVRVMVFMCSRFRDSIARAGVIPCPQMAGRLKQSAARWCYSKIPIDDLCRQAAAIGLVALDLIDEKDWPVLKKYGLVAAMVSGAA